MSAGGGGGGGGAGGSAAAQPSTATPPPSPDSGALARLHKRLSQPLQSSTGSASAVGRGRRMLNLVAASFSVGFLAVNGSTVFLEVSLGEVVRAAEPAFALFMGAGCLPGLQADDVADNRVSWASRAAVVVIVLGVALSAFGAADVRIPGVLLSCCANVLFAARSLYAKALGRAAAAADASPLKGTELFFHVTARGAAVLGSAAVVAWLVGADGGSGAAVVVEGGAAREAGWPPAILLLNGVSWATYNLTSFAVLARVHVVTHAVANGMRRVATILAAVAWFGNVITGTNACGIVIAVFGVLAYAKARQSEMEQAAQAADRATGGKRASAGASDRGDDDGDSVEGNGDVEDRRLLPGSDAR